MNDRMIREQKKKLLLAEGALHRFECVQAQRAIADELAGITHGGPAGVLRAVGGKGLLSLAATALPLVLGAGRVARLLKRGMLIAGGVAAAWSAISTWREQSMQQGDTAAAEGAAANAGSSAGVAAGDAASPQAGAGPGQ